jgi:hemolysin type calcium-binding protein
LPDKIYALRGNDKIDAFVDIRDRDFLFGGRGDDRIEAADVDGKDVLNGGPSFDVCIIDEDEFYGKDATRGCERVRELSVSQLKGRVKIRPAGCTTSEVGAACPSPSRVSRGRVAAVETRRQLRTNEEDARRGR